MAEPMYRRIADDLQGKIESGELEPGSQLPTELELREQYENASRNTVRDAIKWLTNRGLIHTQPGKGTFVADRIDPFVVDLTPNLVEPGLGSFERVAYATDLATKVKSVGRTPSSSVPRVEIIAVYGRVAAALLLDEGDSVVSRHQQRFIDGRPFALQTTFYPIRFVEQGAGKLIQATDIPGGAVPYLQDLLGFREVGYEDRILVRSPTDAETRFFAFGGHVLIMETDRASFDEKGRPIRFTVTVYPSDRNEFVIRAGELPQVENG